MVRTIALLAAVLASATAMRFARPDGLQAKMATREEEDAEKAKKKEEAAARKKMSAEERSKALKDKMAQYDSASGRAQFYAKMARTKKLGMPEAEFQKQQQMYGKMAVTEAQLEAKRVHGKVRGDDVCRGIRGSSGSYRRLTF